MRKVLDALYWTCGVLAGIFMIGIAACILTTLAGAIFGFITRSMDDFAGFSMAASAFLALSYTFHSNEHIRVTLFIQRFRGQARRSLEIWCHILGTILAGFFAYYSVKMTVVSWQIDEVSLGLVPVPLWIPQLGMAIGTVALTIALADRLWCIVNTSSLPGEPQESPAEG